MKKDTEYCVYFDEEQIGEGFEVEFGFAAFVTKNEEGVLVTDRTYGESTFRKIEKLLSEFLVIIGKGINWTVSIALGRTLTMDDIVFNRYDEIRLDYFNFGLDGEEVKSNSKMVDALKTPINKCYHVFTGIALVGYMVILVYVGIQMLLSSTSADKKAAGKTALLHWCTGIIILFMYPYAMKYIILIDDAVVKDIGSYAPQPESTNLVNDGDGIMSDIEEKVDYSSYGNKKTRDYMSKLGFLAQDTLSIGVALAYVIITWQLVMMIVYYYKRVFTVAFLIMVFPFIALTYVIDKLNDGKSQALSAWTREFVFCVIIQIFHATVYVFVVNVIYSTIAQDKIDTILVMIAANFMFEGENILKQIFGGDKTIAVGSPAQNGAKIAAIAGFGMKSATKAIKTGVKTGKALGTGVAHGARIIGDTVGAEKGTRWRSFKDSVRDNSNTYKKFSNVRDQWRLTNGGFERVAERNKKNARMAQLLPSSGDITQNITEAAEAIDLINNGKTGKDLAEGLDKLSELMKKKNSMTPQERKQLAAMMQACSISADQFINIQNGMNVACLMAARGESKKRIDQHLRVTVEYSFSNLSGDEKTRMVSRVYAATMYNMKAGYVDKGLIEKTIEEDWNNKRETMYDYGRNIKFRDSKDTRSNSTDMARQIQNKAKIYQRSLASQIKDYDKLPDEEKKKIKAVGNAIAYINMTKAEQSDKLDKHMAALGQNFGVNQQIVEDFIKKEINQDDLKTKAESGGAMRGIQLVRTRAEGLKKQYAERFGNELPDNMSQQEFDELIEDVAKLEQLNSGEFTAVESGKAFQNVELKGEIAQKLLMISNLDMEIDALKYVLAQKIAENPRETKLDEKNPNSAEYVQMVNWARDAKADMEAKAAASPTEKDPVTSIYDIINAAKDNGNGTRSFAAERWSDIVGADKNDTSVSKEDKEFVKETDSADQEVGKIRRLLKNTWARATDEEYDDMTVNGYTYDDILKMRQVNAMEHAAGAAVTVGETLVKPLLGFTFGAARMALTDDGMPLGEAVTGMTAGASIADNVINRVPESYIAKQKETVKGKVEKRLKDAEKNMLIARGESSEDNINELRLTLISGNRYENADGDFHVTLRIIAENATYMSIGESNYIGPWVPYVEDYDYELKNPKATDVYVRLRDSSGNIINSNVPLN